MTGPQTGPQTGPRSRGSSSSSTAVRAIDDAIDDRAFAVLVAHQRFDIGACRCGWMEPGHSHARHVIEQLRAAGVLRAGEVR